jgi:DNA replication protein DnaC
MAYTKNQLWEMFLKEFETKFSKSLVKSENEVENLKVLFYYFLQDEAFYLCKNLRSDISKPSFQKGMLVIGGCGVGKTAYFKTFESIFFKDPQNRYKYYGAKELVRNYELCQTPLDKDYFFKDFTRKNIFLDDIGSEKEASNFGKVDVIEEVLYLRYEKKLKVHASCNYSSSDMSAEETLKELGNKYGPRIYDRFFGLFNIIEFNGRSYR